MARYCFQLQVRPERIDEYKARHRAVWPEMLRALKDSGSHNYSLFLRPDGLLTPGRTPASPCWRRSSTWRTNSAPSNQRKKRHHDHVRVDH